MATTEKPLEICDLCKSQPRRLLELQHQGRPAIYCPHARVLLLYKGNDKTGREIYEPAVKRHRLWVLPEDEAPPRARRQTGAVRYTILKHSA